MITVNKIEIEYRQGMTAGEAIRKAGEDDSLSVVLVNGIVVSDVRSCEIDDGSVIRLLRIVSGG